MESAGRWVGSTRVQIVLPLGNILNSVDRRYGNVQNKKPNNSHTMAKIDTSRLEKSVKEIEDRYLQVIRFKEQRISKLTANADKLGKFFSKWGKDLELGNMYSSGTSTSEYTEVMALLVHGRFVTNKEYARKKLLAMTISQDFKDAFLGVGLSLTLHDWNIAGTEVKFELRVY